MTTWVKHAPLASSTAYTRSPASPTSTVPVDDTVTADASPLDPGMGADHTSEPSVMSMQYMRPVWSLQRSCTSSETGRQRNTEAVVSHEHRRHSVDATTSVQQNAMETHPTSTPVPSLVS